MLSYLHLDKPRWPPFQHPLILLEDWPLCLTTSPTCSPLDRHTNATLTGTMQAKITVEPFKDCGRQASLQNLFRHPPQQLLFNNVCIRVPINLRFLCHSGRLGCPGANHPILRCIPFCCFVKPQQGRFTSQLGASWKKRVPPSAEAPERNVRFKMCIIERALPSMATRGRTMNQQRPMA